MTLKHNLTILAALALILIVAAGPVVSAAPVDDLVITGVIDGPLTGGIPKAVELYAVNAIPDLSIYGLGSANNGGGTDGEEFTFPAVSVPSGTCIYVASEAPGFNTFFGFNPNYTSGAMAINGDDAVELFADGSVSDVFGEIDVDGTGQPWEHMDGWAYRNQATGPDGSTFVLANWSFSGINALDGESSNSTATTPFPIGTYAPCADSAPSVTSTAPFSGETNVAVDANISIDFSEDVNVTGTWFEISCSSSGTHAAIPSGGLQNYTLDPAADFDNGENCAVTIIAAQVADADADDPPDNMEGDFTFNFDVGGTPDVVINEIHADPANDLAGDANGDGIRDSSQDEFVEIVNTSGDALDLSGWTLKDAVGLRHTFPAGTTIAADCAITVFGGGTPSGAFGSTVVQIASTGFLGFNNGGDTVTLNDGVTDVATYTYGSDGGDNQSLTRDPDITGPEPLVKHTMATGSGDTLYSPGKHIDGSSFSGCPVATFEMIHDIQGSGDASPFIGSQVIIQGIVVGDFQDGASGVSGDLNGFFVQEEDAEIDADPLTSEGIFVFDGSSPNTDVAVGDLVRVMGPVSEFGGLTEITSFSGVTVIRSGNPLPATATLGLPVTADSDFEAYEGMLVTFPQPLVISEYFNFDRFGEIVLTSERHLTPSAAVEPGPAAIAAAEEFLLDRITLDDGRTNQNPDPAIHPNGAVFDLNNLFRGGDTVQNVTGVMHYAFGLYRIQPTQGADYTNANPRTAAPDAVGGNLKVASFNVLNYFTTLDTGSATCGPEGNLGCRGADNAVEFTRQRDKIIAALAAIDADVVGLIEIENHPGDVPTADLVSGLNIAVGAGTYNYVATGAIGTDAIRVALIYKPDTVDLVGDYAALDTEAFTNPLDHDIPRNRPALAQTFMDSSTGGVFTVVVNHFKSKSGSELADSGGICVDNDPDNDILDCDQGDGQAYFNATRTATAQVLADWLATDPTGSGDSNILIIGDLNSYDKEDPIDVLISRGYHDLLFDRLGEQAYSYVFDGQVGYLDYGLADQTLLSQVTGVTAWHINADEPDLIDYDTSFKGPNQDAIYADDAYRASDHDPVIVGLDLNGSPDCSAASPSLAMLWPPNHEFVPIDILDVTDPEGDAFTITIDSIFQDEAVDALDSGNTAPDGRGVGTPTAEVRAERIGDGGNGRVYHISFTAEDTFGGTCSETVLVSVPVSKKSVVVDDGPLYDSTVEP